MIKVLINNNMCGVLEYKFLTGNINLQVNTGHIWQDVKIALEGCLIRLINSMGDLERCKK